MIGSEIIKRLSETKAAAVVGAVAGVVLVLIIIASIAITTAAIAGQWSISQNIGLLSNQTNSLANHLRTIETSIQTVITNQSERNRTLIEVEKELVQARVLRMQMIENQEAILKQLGN